MSTTDIVVNLTEDEAFLLGQMAATLNVTIQEFMIKCAMNQAVKVSQVVELSTAAITGEMPDNSAKPRRAMDDEDDDA